MSGVARLRRSHVGRDIGQQLCKRWAVPGGAFEGAAELVLNPSNLAHASCSFSTGVRLSSALGRRRLATIGTGGRMRREPRVLRGDFAPAGGCPFEVRLYFKHFLKQGRL